MFKIISFFLPILWVSFTEVQCNDSVDPWWDPRVWPEKFEDDGKPFVELTCGAYLKSQEWLSWYGTFYGVEGTIATTIMQLSDGYRTLKLLWPRASLQDREVYCAKENETYWNGEKQYWRKKTRSKSIRFPLKSEKEIYPSITDKGLGPWLMKTTEDEKRVELTCYAYLNKSKRLSCYQIKDERNVSMLGMIQQDTDYGYVKITLQKTLELSDNGSVIYCARQGSKWEEIPSDNILITFERKIESLETPYVTVEPSSDVVFFEQGEVLELLCRGSEPADGRALTWHLTSGLNEVVADVPPDQHYYKSTKQNRLSLPMEANYHGKQIYCAQDFTMKLSDSSVMSYRELVRSRTITLLDRAQCDTTKSRDQPRVIPATFVDEHKPHVQFTCYAFLKPGQLLSWYQSKEITKSAGLMLRMIQLQDPKTKEGEWTVLTLNKTLEPSDSGSEIYCAQQSVRPDGSFSDEEQTQRIALKVQGDIPPLEHPFIRVEPNNASVSFHVNTTLRLACGGSKPVDGRTYTWFKKGLKSSLTVPKDQKYDASTNLNVLYLSLNESHHLNKLFCAQGFLAYIRHTDGSLHVKSYGELVESTIITLIQQEKDVEKQDLASCPNTGNTHLLVSVATPLALLSLLAAATACWALRRRRAARPEPSAPAPPSPAPRTNTDDTCGDYVNLSRMVSPQVTYAVLDLPRSAGAARAPPAPDQALYAEVAREPPQVTYATLDLPNGAPAARAPPAPQASLYAEIARVCNRKQ